MATIRDIEFRVTADTSSMTKSIRVLDRFGRKINEVARKLERQTKRAKDLQLYDRGIDPNEVKTVQEATGNRLRPTAHQGEAV